MSDDLELIVDEAMRHAPRQTRRLTFYQACLAVGALSGAFVALSAVVSIAADRVPFAKKEDVTKIDNRLSKVEASIVGIQYNQLESLELQLTDRVQKINDDIRTAGVYADQRALRHDQNETQLRLEDVHAKKMRMQQALSE